MLNEKFIKKYKTLFQSIVLFPSWLLLINTICCFLFYIFILLISGNNIILSISILLVLLGLFLISINSIKEKKWNYLNWLALSIAALLLVFLIPNGIFLLYLPAICFALTIFSYFGFYYSYKQEKIPKFIIIKSLILFFIFVSHVFILAYPEKIGLTNTKENMQNSIFKYKKEIKKMTPIEFSRTKIGKEIAIKIYKTSILIEQKELEKIIENDPIPMIQAKKITAEKMSDIIFSDLKPHFYIFNIYLNSVIKDYNKLKK